MQEVQNKWDKAVGGDAMKELGKSWDELDDTSYSYKLLHDENPESFMSLSRSSAERLNEAFRNNPALQTVLENAAKQNGISPQLVQSIITMEQRGWSGVPGGLGIKEGLASATKNPENVSVGPAQLKGPARNSAGLTMEDARTYDGAIRGAANWLSDRNPNIKAGSTEAQRAAAYNGSTAYGVQYQAVRNQLWP
jgi:hypothetical protein